MRYKIKTCGHENFTTGLFQIVEYSNASEMRKIYRMKKLNKIFFMWLSEKVISFPLKKSHLAKTQSRLVFDSE